MFLCYASSLVKDQVSSAKRRANIGQDLDLGWRVNTFGVVRISALRSVGLLLVGGDSTKFGRFVARG